MLIPEHCSAKVDGEECQLMPSYVVSIQSQEGEYMLAVVCDEHKNGLEARLIAMQKEGKVPHGGLHFQPIKAVVTDCVTGMKEDFIEIESKRGIESDRSLA
jgi:hypothetical protein